MAAATAPHMPTTATAATSMAVACATNTQATEYRHATFAEHLVSCDYANTHKIVQMILNSSAFQL